MNTRDVEAVFLAERLELSPLKSETRIANGPPLFALESGGHVVVFRHGAAVFFDVDHKVQRDLERSCKKARASGCRRPSENARSLQFDKIGPPGAIDGEITTPADDAEAMQVIAEALSRTVALAHRETEVAQALEALEPEVEELRRRGRASRSVRRLTRLIGRVARAQTRLASRVEVSEKPDAIWDRPELERLYDRIADDYELLDRARILDRKAMLLSQTAGTLVELAAHRAELAAGVVHRRAHRRRDRPDGR